jgi:hypothetical protein
MASTFSTDLKLELMATGENAGTWGDITNDNLDLVQQAVAGYQEIDVASADVTLVMTDGTISNARNMTLKFTGTLAANRTVNFPTGIEKLFNIIDGTDHANNTLTFKVTSQTGFLLCEGHSYICHADGTDIVKDLEFKKWRAISSAASPALGDEVSFIDSDYTFDTNSLTVGRNSSNIAGAAADLVVSTEGAGFTLVYSGDATTGWTYRDK